jgi:iron(III) transport system substrate-binding protein
MDVVFSRRILALALVVSVALLAGALAAGRLKAAPTPREAAAPAAEAHPGPAQAATPAGAGALMVYSSRSHYGSEPVFDAFAKKTGIAVRFFHGNNNEVFERLRNESAHSPADVLLTVDAGNLWNAARSGLLVPIDSKVLAANIPAELRDPDGRWFGLAVRARTVMYSTERVTPAELTGLQGLADPKWKGRLCLRTSTNVYNQSLLSAAIKQDGEAKVEAMVRGWIANQPIYINGDTQILEAIAAGRCDVGVTNTYYLARLLEKNPGFPVAPFWTAAGAGGVHVNVSGAGVTVSSKRRASAVALLEYLSSEEAQGLLAGSSFEYPANPAVDPHPILKQWGPYSPQRVGVGAAGEFQAAAVRLADRAGYK